MQNRNILLTMSMLQFHIDEGAKQRLNSFIESYSDHGYKVTVLLFYSVKSFKYLRQRKRFLNPKARWVLYPSIPISCHPVLTKFAVFYMQIVFGLYTRIYNFPIVQSELSGVICRYKRPNSFLIVDFHGDAVSETDFNYNNKAGWLAAAFLKWQRESIRLANHIIVVSQELKQQLEKNTSEQIEEFSIISCGADVGRFDTAKPAKIGERLKDRIVVGYSGGLQKWQNIDKVLDVVEGLRSLNKDIYFMLCTNSDIGPIKNRLDKLGTSNHSVHQLSSQEVPSYIKIFAAGFLIRDNLILNRVSSPTKLAEYLAAGAVVICTAYAGDYKRSINHGIEGFVLSDLPLQDKQLAELNEYLIKVKENRAYHQQQCLKAARASSWPIEFSNYYKQIF